jgi:hypothetical protein
MPRMQDANVAFFFQGSFNVEALQPREARFRGYA